MGKDAGVRVGGASHEDEFEGVGGRSIFSTLTNGQTSHFFLGSLEAVIMRLFLTAKRSVFKILRQSLRLRLSIISGRWREFNSIILERFISGQNDLRDSTELETKLFFSIPIKFFS